MKEVQYIKGLNLGNFEEMYVNLNKISGIQWGNGVGKGYLKNMIILGLSTRLNYDVQDVIKSTPECSLLLESTNANAPINKKAEKYLELDKKFKEIFNQAKNKSNQSFIFINLINDEEDTEHIVITYPTVNIKELERVQIIGEIGAADEIYNELKKMINYKGYTVSQSISEIVLLARSKKMIVKTETANKKSLFLIKKEKFYLGNDTPYSHGENILLGVSDDTINTLNKIIIDGALKEIHEKVQKTLEKENDTELVSDIFLNKKSKIGKNLTKFIEIKETNPLDMENKILILKETIKEANLDKLAKFYFTYSEKISDIKEFNISKKNQKEIEKNTIIESQNKLITERDNLIKNISLYEATTVRVNGKIQHSINAFKELEEMNISFNNIDKEINILLKDIERLSEIKKSNLSVKEQLTKINKELKKEEDSIKNIDIKIEEYTNEIKKLRKIIENNEEPLYCSKRSNEDIDFVLNIFNLKSIKDVEKTEDFINIAKIVKNNPKDFNNSYIEVINKIKLEDNEENFIERKNKEIIELKELIKEKEILKEVSINNIQDLKKDKESLILDKTPTDQLIQKENEFTSLKKLRTRLDILNDKEQFMTEDISIELTEEEIEEIASIFRLSSSEEEIELKIKLLSELNNNFKKKLSILKEEKNNILEIIKKRDEDIKNKDIEISELLKDLSDVKDLNEIKEYLNKNNIFEYEIDENIYNAPLIKTIEDINIEYKNVQEKFVEFQNIFFKFNDLVYQFKLSKPETFTEYVSFYTDFISRIRSKLNSLKISREGILATFLDDISYINEYIETVHSKMRSLMKKRTGKISDLKCSSGDSFKIKNDFYIEFHPQEIQLNRLLKEIFKNNSLYDIDDAQLDYFFDKASKEDIQLLRDVIVNFGNNPETGEFSLEQHLKRKTRDFSFDSSKASTGNAFVLNVGVRQDLMFKNKFFRMTTFIDEFSTIDYDNIEIMFSQDLRQPVCFLQNSSSDFDKIRQYIHCMNTATGERGSYRNILTWLIKENKNEE